MPSWRHRGALVAILLFAALLRISFGWPMPNANRAVDERFSLENVEALLRTGSFTPLTAYHPSVSYLPQTAALALVQACDCLRLGTAESQVLRERTGWSVASAKHGRPNSGLRPVPHLTPLAYRSCRLLQALLGTATVLCSYWLGRRLMSPAVGLGAALLVAGVPWLIWASGICNEDAVFILMFVVVALATLRACELPTTPRFAWLGVACGVALASKLNAAPACLPILFWVVWRRREWRRAMPRLVLAGALAAATFTALNPHFVTRFEIVRRDFSVTLRNYEMKSRLQLSSKPGVFASGLLSVLERESLGPLAGAAALTGGLLVARRRRDSAVDAFARGTIALGFPASYLAFYALATGNVSAHNWLPLTPFFAILGATTSDALWRYRAPAPVLGAAVRTAAARLAAIAILCAPAAAGARFVYRALVPTTASVGKGILDRAAKSAKSHAFVGIEVRDDRAFVGEPELKRLRMVLPGDSSRFTEEQRERLDGWVEPVHRREGADSGREALAGAHEELVHPSLFSRRGPVVRVVWRPWQRAGAQRRELLSPGAETRKRFREPPSPAAGAPLASLRLWPTGRWQARRCWLRAASRAIIPLHAPRDRSQRGSRSGFVESERYSSREAESLVLVCQKSGREPPRFSPQVEIISWARGSDSPNVAETGSEGSRADNGR